MKNLSFRKFVLFSILFFCCFFIYSEDGVKQYVVKVDDKNADEIYKMAKTWVKKQDYLLCDDSVPSEEVECRKTYNELMNNPQNHNLFYRIMIQSKDGFLVYVFSIECKDGKARFSYYANYDTMLNLEKITELQIESFEKYCNPQKNNDW